MSKKDSQSKTPSSLKPNRQKFLSRLGVFTRAGGDILAGRSPYRGWTGLGLAVRRLVAWPFRYAAWRLRCRWGPAAAAGGLPPITVILLSYGRPQNMHAQVQAALACAFVAEVIVSNNNPRVEIAAYVRQRDHRLRLIQQTERTGCIKRIELARDLGRSFYICLDDDLYLWPSQLRALAWHLVQQPEAVHGITGQDLPSLSGEQGGSYRNEERPVEVLNRIYAFTSAHARRVFVLIDLLRRVHPDIASNPSLIEDLLLSYSGRGRPRMHALGPYIPDPSGMDLRQAMHGQPEWATARKTAVAWLRSLSPSSVSAG